MSKEENFYNSSKLKRSLGEMKTLSKKNANHYGSIHEPLLNIDIDHIVIDELHLLMRVVDVLLRNLIEDSVRLDQKNNLGKKISGIKNKNREELVELIQKCGVHFQIWEGRQKDGFGDSFKNLEWTSLTGSDMKKLLQKLPDFLDTCTCINIQVRPKVASLWREFKDLYYIMNSSFPSENEITSFHNQAKQFVCNFLALGL